MIFSRFYIWACVLFPVLFYIPKWFELESEFILKPACQTLGGTYEGLIRMLTGEEMRDSKKQKIVDMINCLNETLSRNCWNSNWTPIQEVNHHISHHLEQSELVD